MCICVYMNIAAVCMCVSTHCSRSQFHLHVVWVDPGGRLDCFCALFVPQPEIRASSLAITVWLAAEKRVAFLACDSSHNREMTPLTPES